MSRVLERTTLLARSHRLSVSRRRTGRPVWAAAAVVVALAVPLVLEWGRSPDVLGAATVAMATLPCVTTVRHLVLPPASGVVRPDHLLVTPVSPGMVSAALLLARVHVSATPVRTVVVGVYAVLAATHGWWPAAVVIALVLIGGPAGYVAAVAPSVGKITRSVCVVGALAVPGSGLVGPAWSVAVSAVTVGVLGATSVVGMRRSLEPSAVQPYSSRRVMRGARCPHLRFVAIDLHRNRRWGTFAASWMLTAVVTALAAADLLGWSVAGVPLGVDITPVVPVVAVYAALGVTYGLIADRGAVAWVVDVPHGVRRHLWARVVVWCVGTSPCWLTATVIVGISDPGPAWCAVPVVYAVCAVRAAAASTRSTEPSGARIVVELVWAAVLFAVLAGALGALPVRTGALVVAGTVVLVTLWAVAVSRRWRDDGRVWFAVAQWAHGGPAPR